jgi:hypothetical protein
MTETHTAILLIADISGYTRFMRMHEIATSHAKEIIVSLIKSIIRASRPPLKIAELEGDAVFFYALSTGQDIQDTAGRVKDQIAAFFSTFKKEKDSLVIMDTCGCDACSHVGDLRLKLIIHIGNIAIESIEKFEKLFGLDVILAHRLLKNSVKANEYVLMTDPMYRTFVDFYGLAPEKHTETYEGVGQVETVVFYPRPLLETSRTVDEIAPTSRSERSWWNLRLRLRTFRDRLRVFKHRGAFRNLPGP